MNTPNSVAYGWAACMFFGVAGGYLGYRKSMKEKEVMIVEAVELRRKQAETLARLNAKMELREKAKAAKQLARSDTATLIKPSKRESKHPSKSE